MQEGEAETLSGVSKANPTVSITYLSDAQCPMGHKNHSVNEEFY